MPNRGTGRPGVLRSSPAWSQTLLRRRGPRRADGDVFFRQSGNPDHPRPLAGFSSFGFPYQVPQFPFSPLFWGRVPLLKIDYRSNLEDLAPFLWVFCGKPHFTPPLAFFFSFGFPFLWFCEGTSPQTLGLLFPLCFPFPLVLFWVGKPHFTPDPLDEGGGTPPLVSRRAAQARAAAGAEEGLPEVPFGGVGLATASAAFFAVFLYIYIYMYYYYYYCCYYY